jgi:hypothetical protein
LTLRPDLEAEEGDISEMLESAGTAAADLVLGFIAGRIKATFVDGAEGDDLTTLIEDHSSIQRDEAAQAIGQATFTRPTAAGGAGTIEAGATVGTTPDATGAFQTFTSDVDAVFGASDLSVTVAATAVDAGRDGNVSALEVNRVLDAVFDTSITVSNAERFAGGSDEQSDEDFRAEYRGFHRTAQRGTFEALERGARKVAAVTRATAVEDEVGLCTLFASDADGNSNAQMVDAVELELLSWRAVGALVTVTGGVRVVVPIDVSLSVRAGVDVAAIADSVRRAIVAAVRRLRPGDTLHRGLIEGAVRNVDREAIVGVTVNSPAADIVPAPSEVIRAELSQTTVS